MQRYQPSGLVVLASIFLYTAASTPAWGDPFPTVAETSRKKTAPSSRTTSARTTKAFVQRTSKNSGPFDTLRARDLPHLQLVIRLESVARLPAKNLTPEHVGWSFDSLVAYPLYPAQGSTGTTSVALPYAGNPLLYRGVVINGCMGSPPNVDLSLYNTFADASIPFQNELLLELTLNDHFEGWGHYLWSSTLTGKDYQGSPVEINSNGTLEAFCSNDQD